MIEKVRFSTLRDTTAGNLIITTNTSQMMDFGQFSEYQSVPLLKVLDENEAANLVKNIEARGKTIGRLRGKGFFGDEITVYENKIFSNTKEMNLDANTVAEVILEGQKVITARPTLTRMAALSFLPGTALIPGLALQKKSVKDERQLIIVIANAESNISFELAIDQLAPAKAMANQINAIAESKHREATPVPQKPPPLVEPAASSGSIVQELKELKQLLDSGVITQQEFESLKQKMIGNP